MYINLFRRSHGVGVPNSTNDHLSTNVKNMDNTHDIDTCQPNNRGTKQSSSFKWPLSYNEMRRSMPTSTNTIQRNTEKKLSPPELIDVGQIQRYQNIANWKNSRAKDMVLAAIPNVVHKYLDFQK